MHRGGIADLGYPSSKTRRGRVQGNGRICPTLTTMGEIYRMENEYAIYKLTTKEYWRMMDFDDADHDKAAAVNKKNALYKQAGNSIVVNVLVAIFGQMFEGKENEYKRQ